MRAILIRQFAVIENGMAHLARVSKVQQLTHPNFHKPALLAVKNQTKIRGNLDIPQITLKHCLTTFAAQHPDKQSLINLLFHTD
jgi:hypothetical protein